MTGNTGLLTSRCDPFGAESQVQLLGGMYDEKYRGKYMWHCDQPAIGRYGMICTGGDYGHRAQGDGGLVHATHCDGGHKGQIMALCRIHVRDFTTGPPKPGFSRDLKTPHGQVGGTRATDMCPACMWPPEARTLQEQADALQQEMSRLRTGPMELIVSGHVMRRFAQMEAVQDQVRARLDELYQTGRVHKCPLTLREVS
jgi:hypothetical protein